MNLATLTSAFTQGLDPGCSDKQRETAAQLIDAGGDLQPVERLRIYQHNVSATHQRVMEKIFPVCRQILGEPAFANISRDYSWARPTSNPDLNQYADTFPEFIGDLTAARPELEGFEYLQDLTRLEYFWHAAYYTANDEAFDFRKFARLQNGDIFVETSNSLKLMYSDYPVQEIWRQHRQGKITKEIVGLEKRQYLLIYRPEFEPQLVQITAQQFHFLKGSMQGMSLSVLAETGDAVAALDTVADMVTNGWITGFRRV